ncbi:MAG: hypothetical protein J6T31_04580, partial [Methanobrevibacter sp.]|nr:hypothetical protein [Methanobrevibacter sp.]
MKKSKNMGVLISLVLVLLLALGAASAADDAIIDDADLASVDEIHAIDDTPTTDEINAESTDIIVTD